MKTELEPAREGIERFRKQGLPLRRSGFRKRHVHGIEDGLQPTKEPAAQLRKETP